MPAVRTNTALYDEIPCGNPSDFHFAYRWQTLLS